jgi:hypothetical protein
METGIEISKKIDERVGLIFENKDLAGFQRGLQLAEAMSDLRLAMNDEYMSKMMQLQGSKIGFRTDKDKEGGYTAPVVKDCIIEATLKGVEVVGNQFNIIAGNMYVTKEGFQHLLKKIPGLYFNVYSSGVNIAGDSKSAVVNMTIQYKLNGKEENEVVPFGVKMNAYMGADGAIGKAERKARKWLYEKITGLDFGDDEVEPIQKEPGTVTVEKADKKAAPKDKDEAERARCKSYLDGIADLPSLKAVKAKIPPHLLDLYDIRETELLAAEVESDLANESQ